jgi:hypothetical protein
MAILRLFRSETLRLMVMGFVLGTVGFVMAQPGTAQDDGQAVIAATR